MYWVAGSRVLSAAPSAPQPGATLVLEDVHEYFLPARRLAAHLAEVLGRTVRINAYATPGNARGFAAHSHGNPSVLLQQAGSRKWLVAPPATPQPSPRLRRHCDPPTLTAAQREQARAAAMPFWLHPGQVLYLPVGWLHWGSTGPQPSLHLGIEWDGPFLGAGGSGSPGS
jgi:ribosomal protein L16 Arg81 hydroxylase